MRYGNLYDEVTSGFNCSWVDNGYQDMVYRYLLGGSHRNLANRGNGDSGWSSKLDPSILFPSSSGWYYPGYHITSVLGYPQGVGVPLLYYFISPTSILMDGKAGARGENYAFGINTEPDAITKNEDFISQDSMHVNQNDI